jgi:hypothetical protein
MDTKVMTNTTAIDAVSPVSHGERTERHGVAGLLVAWSLLLMPTIAAHAAADEPHESAISVHARSFGAAVKRDTNVVGTKCREGAHRVSVAAKAVAHEIATAAKRGAVETRAAFRGEKESAPAG